MLEDRVVELQKLVVQMVVVLMVVVMEQLEAVPLIVELEVGVLPI